MAYICITAATLSSCAGGPSDMSIDPAVDEVIATEVRQSYADVPRVDNQSETETFLQEHWPRISVLHESALRFIGNNAKDVAFCEEQALLLNQAISLEEASALIGSVPDEVLRASLDGQRDSLATALAECVTSADTTVSGTELARVTALVELRLNDLGWER